MADGFTGGFVGGALGSTVGRAIVELIADSSKLDRDFKQAQAQVDTGTRQMGQSVHRMGGAMKAGLLIAGAAVVRFAASSIASFREHEQVIAQFQNTLSLTPGYANANIDSFERMATSLQNLSGRQDEEILQAQQVLLQFGLTEDQLRELTPLVVDYAVKTGKDVPTAAGLLGRALLGNARGLKAIGIEFTATGDRMKDVATLTDLLRGKVDGAAEAFASTDAGKVAILDAKLDDMKETFGRLVSQGIAPVVEVFDKLVTGFNALPEPIQKTIFITGGLVLGLAVLGAAVNAIRSGLSGLGLSFGSSAAQVAGSSAAMAAELAAVNSQLTLYIANASGAVVETRLLAAAQAQGAASGAAGGATAAGGAAAGIGTAGGAFGVIGAFGAGYGIGTAIDQTFHLSDKFSKAIVPDFDADEFDRDVDSISGKLDQLKASYRSGTISFDEFEKGVKRVNDEFGTGFNAEGLIRNMDAGTEHIDQMAQHTERARQTLSRFLTQTGTEAADFAEELAKALGPDGAGIDAFISEQIASLKEYRDGIASTFNGVSDALHGLAGDSKVTAAQIIESFDDQLEAMDRYGQDFNIIVERAKGKKGAKGLLEELSKMGLEGANVVHALANANESEFDKIVTQWRFAGKQSDDIATLIQTTLVGAIHDLINAIREAAGLPPIDFTVKADTSQAQEQIKILVSDANENGIVIVGGTKKGSAHDGRMVTHSDAQAPGGTADEKVVKVQTGEIIMNRRASLEYGAELMALNQRYHGVAHDGGFIDNAGVLGGQGISDTAQGVRGIHPMLEAMYGIAPMKFKDPQLASQVTGPGGLANGPYVQSPWGIATPAADRYVRWVIANFPAAVNYGVYNRRVIAGTSTWSQHAYANAVDAGVVGVGGIPLGDAIYAAANSLKSALSIANLIWYRADHYGNHVHADFYPQGTGTPPYLDDGGVSIGPGVARMGRRAGRELHVPLDPNGQATQWLRQAIDGGGRRRRGDDPIVVNVIIDNELVARSRRRREVLRAGG